MIDETQLRDWLTSAADAEPVPDDGVGRVLVAHRERAERVERVDPSSRLGRRQPRWLVVAVPAAVVAIVAAAVVVNVGGSPGTSTRFSKVGGAVAGGAAAGAGTAVGDGASTGVGTLSNGRVDASGSTGISVGAAGGATVNASGVSSLPATATAAPAPLSIAPAAVQTRIIKTGSIEIEVARGRFGQTVTSLTALATGLGGYVSESKTFENDTSPSGSVTLRVPVNAFESLVAQVRAKGKVKSATSAGQDVTGQYTDLQARLTALTAARDQLLTVLRQARSIPDILSVQDRITGVQAQIEQLQGQVKVLEDQTAFGTLSVSVAEPGAVKPIEPTPTKRRGIKKAWHQAVDGFVGGVEAIVAHSGAVLLVLLVLAAMAAAAWGLWRVGRRRIV